MRDARWGMGPGVSAVFWEQQAWYIISKSAEFRITSGTQWADRARVASPMRMHTSTMGLSIKDRDVAMEFHGTVCLFPGAPVHITCLCLKWGPAWFEVSIERERERERFIHIYIYILFLFFGSFRNCLLVIKLPYTWMCICKFVFSYVCIHVLSIIAL